ncbi:MAG: hypothetical protein LBN32_02010 [Helicobacteraceae bacterium]|nr:hypothetical protein [Helicobacteraceae bacterium]
MEKTQKQAKDRFIGMRLSTETIDRLKERAAKSGAKNLSVYARQILERPPELDQNLVKEISRILDLTMQTRQSIGSLTGNINQIAKYYNTNAIEGEMPPNAYLEFDRKSRVQLLPAVKELRALNAKLIELCNKILGLKETKL